MKSYKIMRKIFCVAGFQKVKRLPMRFSTAVNQQSSSANLKGSTSSWTGRSIMTLSVYLLIARLPSLTFKSHSGMLPAETMNLD